MNEYKNENDSSFGMFFQLSVVLNVFFFWVSVFAWILHRVMFTFSVLVCAISRNQPVLHCCVCVWYVCFVFIALGIMPCGHVRGVAEPERARGGNRWLQNPLPLVFPLPVCLSPSLLHSFHGRSVHLAGRKACCFDASSHVQRGRPCPRAVPTSAESTTISPPSLLKAPTAQGLQLCVSVCVWFWSNLPGSSQNSYTYTHTHVPTGRKRYWICRSSSGQWESHRKFYTTFLSFLHTFYPLLFYTTQLWNFFTLGNFVQLYFNLFFWMCQSKQTISAFSCKVICVGEFWTVFGICFWGADSEPDSKDKRNVAGLFWSLVFCLFYLLSLC